MTTGNSDSNTGNATTITAQGTGLSHTLAAERQPTPSTTTMPHNSHPTSLSLNRDKVTAIA